MIEPSTVTAARRAFGRQLAGLRTAEGLTQAALAKLIDCSRSTVANIETGYQFASPVFCRKCDDVLSTGGVLRIALDELEELQRESHRRAAASAENDRKTQIEEFRQQGLVVPESPVNGAAALAIRQALATLADHASGNFNGVEPDGLETCVLDAYRQQKSVGEEPRVVLVGGFAGSGKREFARFLSSVTGWALLDKHTITHEFVECLLLAYGGDANDRHSTLYVEHVRPLEYRCLVDSMTENLRCGVSTVVTAPFVREFADMEWMTRVRNRCAAHRARLSVVWVNCDEASMRDYIAFRGAARDSWKLNNWPDYLNTIDLTFAPPFDHYFVDNRLNAAVALADQACEIAARVQA